MANLWWRLVRLGFRLLYNEMAFTYDLVSKVVSLGAWRCWQRTSLKYLPPSANGPILELAHGTGDLQLDLHAAGYRPVGYDLSPYMGRIARRKLQKNGLTPLLAQGTARKLPFANGTFAAVVSTFPTDFIAVPDTLHEVCRVLQPDGRLVIVTNGILTGGGLIKNFLEWLYRITGQRGERYEDIPGFFAAYGFEAALHEEVCPRSVASVIVSIRR